QRFVMTPQQFAALTEQGFNRIPVTRQVLADLDTPLTTYLKLANAPFTYLLESVQGGEKWGRYSMIGLPAREVLSVTGYTVRLHRDGQLVEEQQVADPLAYVSEFQQRYRVPQLDGLPKFNGGLVGYFGYVALRYIEPRSKESCPPDTLRTPDIVLMVSEEVVVFDNLCGKLHLIVLADPAQPDALANAEQRLETLRQQLRQPYTGSVGHPLAAAKAVQEDDIRSLFGEQPFMQAVDSIKEYVLAEHSMECVIS